MKDNEILKKYRSLTQREHVYKLPDSYIGSIEESLIDSWKIEGNKVKEVKLKNIPGLYKIFDEVLVNAWDQYVRTKGTKNEVKNIDVIVNKDIGKISIKNDGKGIDIEMHPKEKVYTVQMIFGKLLTSANYTENEARLTGGKNGLMVSSNKLNRTQIYKKYSRIADEKMVGHTQNEEDAANKGFSVLIQERRVRY